MQPKIAEENYFSASMPQSYNTLLFTNTYGCGYLDWCVIVNVAYNVLIIWPIYQMISFPLSNTVRVISVLL